MISIPNIFLTFAAYFNRYGESSGIWNEKLEINWILFQIPDSRFLNQENEVQRIQTND